MTSLLSAYQERERKLLETQYHGRSVYCLDRAWLAQLAGPYINHLIACGVSPRILEVGCGNGESLKRIANEHGEVIPQNLLGTSLSRLPSHSDLGAIGIRVEPNIIAESLPSKWQNNFDIVMASVVMQWTELELAVPAILNTIKSGGYFLGYDTVGISTSIEHLAQSHAFVSILQGEPRQIKDHHSFVIYKH